MPPSQVQVPKIFVKFTTSLSDSLSDSLSYNYPDDTYTLSVTKSRAKEHASPCQPSSIRAPLAIGYVVPSNTHK
eukprot:scaffold9323_cov74-Skeletonema_dohrnii-CCMP3373.AAC.2